MNSNKIIKQKQSLNIEEYNLLLNSGLKYLYEKNYPKAKDVFFKLITLEESRYEGFLNLSNIMVLKKKNLDAEKILLNYINKNNYNIKIISALATLYYNIKDYEKLDILIEKYIKLEDNYLLDYLKSTIHEKNNNTEKQINYLKKTIKKNKDFWQAYEKLINLFEKLNKIDDLSKIITLAKNNFKNNKKINFYFALCLFRKNKAELALIKLNFEQTEKDFSSLHNKTYLINFYDLVSKIYLNLKKYELSLKYAVKRNSISINNKDNKKHNKKVVIDTIKKYQIYFKSNLINLDKKNNFGLSHENLVFLVGFPRSGTTLIDSILRSHSKTIVLEEKPYLINIRHKFFKKNNLESIGSITKNEIINLQNIYFNSFNYDHEKVIIDKFPLNLIELGFIKKIFPKSKVILALRHPLDTILSCVLTSFKMNDAMANFENLHTSAFFYNEVFSVFNIYKNFFKLNYHQIKYENIVTNFNNEISLLLKFLNLKNEEALKSYYITAKNRQKINTPSYHQVIKPIYNQSINRYKNFTDIESIRPLVKKWIQEFNY
ncbi:sulfotransferase [Alphaproteobacteria bacterium]|nr:sulfotransferase [Alphaproteobacteria bacterium]